MQSLSLLPLSIAFGGCALFTVQQDQFTPLSIQADRPAPPPPRVVLTESSIQISDKIQFAFNSAEILPESNGLLDEIVRVMQENPQLEKIQVEGHTDNTGAANYNRGLSKRRAESVVAYFVSKGVDRKRFVPKGFGPDRPIADNSTDEGRERNRRVEFNIIKQGPKEVIVQEQ